MNDYLFYKTAVIYYDATRHTPGINYSSKLSPWLANGSLSPRRLYHSVTILKEEVDKLDYESIRTFIYQL